MGQESNDDRFDFEELANNIIKKVEDRYLNDLIDQLNETRISFKAGSSETSVAIDDLKKERSRLDNKNKFDEEEWIIGNIKMRGRK